MKSIFQGNWTDVHVTEYLKEAIRTDIFWLGNRIGHDCTGKEIRRFPMDVLEGIFHITKTKPRQCTINSNREWMEFIRSCYSLNCINCGDQGWKAIKGNKQLFDEWMETAHVRENAVDTNWNPGRKCQFFRYDEGKFKENSVIVTVFDTGKDSRLIVDGLHRAAALTMACEDGINISQVKIIECAGNQVNVVYPCDVHQLPD